jgi:hypothetical protein
MGSGLLCGALQTRAATLLNFDFTQNGTGALDKSVTYTVGTYSVTLTGMKNWGTGGASPTYKLYETVGSGLGINSASDSSLDGYAIQFSTAGLALDVSAVTLTISGTGGWQIYVSNSAGIVGGQPYVGGNGAATINLMSAADYSNNISNLLVNSYISIVGTGGPVYISGLSVTSTAAPAPTPEPGTMASLLIGTAILIPSLLKSRAKKSMQK